jgi:hypothetical protein
MANHLSQLWAENEPPWYASVRYMPAKEFDATEVVAGFPLPSIRHALQWVGVMDDRDDIKTVAEALKCPNSQAERVLENLEERGFVAKGTRKRQWEQTPLGWRLSHEWQPPRRIHPVIVRDDDDDDDDDVINRGFDTVPCFILRSNGDDDTFEEADLDVGVWVQYESDKVVELNISQPYDYEHRNSSRIEWSVYLGVADAKQFAKALLEAIEHGEKEIARRVAYKPRKRKQKTAAAFKRDATTGFGQRGAAQPSAAARPKAKKATKLAPKSKDPLAATLKELRGIR